MNYDLQISVAVLTQYIQRNMHTVHAFVPFVMIWFRQMPLIVFSITSLAPRKLETGINASKTTIEILVTKVQEFIRKSLYNHKNKAQSRVYILLDAQ